MFFPRPAAPGDAREHNQSYQTPRLLFPFSMPTRRSYLNGRVACGLHSPSARVLRSLAEVLIQSDASETSHGKSFIQFERGTADFKVDFK